MTERLQECIGKNWEVIEGTGACEEPEPKSDTFGRHTLGVRHPLPLNNSLSAYSNVYFAKPF